MLGTVGDLVEDIVVRVDGAVHVASDTDATIVRRAGGSAANMAVAVVRAGGRARFIGQVGDDAAGEHLVRDLAGAGVDAIVRRRGRTGTIVVLLDAAGERTFLTDRATYALLDDPDPAWLDGLTALHVPVYSLVGEPLASTAVTMIGWAHDRGVLVSVDASSSSVLEQHGDATIRALLAGLAPDVLVCNEMEAQALGGVDGVLTIGAGVTVVKRGAAGATVWSAAGSGSAVGSRPVAGSSSAVGRVAVDVPAEQVPDVRDTTGAGDAFAAGLLVALTAGSDAVAATRHGHRAAAAAIRLVTASVGRAGIGAAHRG